MECSATLTSYNVIYAFLCVDMFLDYLNSSIHYNVMGALSLKLSVFSMGGKYIPRLACPGLISADSEESLHTYQTTNRQCPRVTLVHVQYVCRRLCVENNVYSSVLGLATQTHICMLFLQSVVQNRERKINNKNIHFKRRWCDMYPLMQPYTK